MSPMQIQTIPQRLGLRAFTAFAAQRQVRRSHSTISTKAAADNPTQQKYKLTSKAKDKRYDVDPADRLNFATSAVPAFVRLGTAGFVVDGVEDFKRPEKPIELYEFQGCPFCRKVREATSLLDLDVMFWPCPKEGPTYRPKAIEMSGKKQFPFMIDPNTGTKMLDSDAIVKYLFNTYGDGKVPAALALGPLTTLGVSLGQAPRLGNGIKYRLSRKPDEPLEIWGYEASPFCLQIREVLTELEIPHIYHSCARGSPKRPAMEAKWGVGQYPYIEDPNTNIAMFETPLIRKYLEETYAL